LQLFTQDKFSFLRGKWKNSHPPLPNLEASKKGGGQKPRRGDVDDTFAIVVRPKEYVGVQPGFRYVDLATWKSIGMLYRDLTLQRGI
jgi:hypothetical protein